MAKAAADDYNIKRLKKNTAGPRDRWAATATHKHPDVQDTYGGGSHTGSAANSMASLSTFHIGANLWHQYGRLQLQVEAPTQSHALDFCSGAAP